MTDSWRKLREVEMISKNFFFVALLNMGPVFLIENS